MTSPLDLLRSMVRTAGERAHRDLRSLPGLPGIRRALEALRVREARVEGPALARAIAQARGFSAVTIDTRDGLVRVDGTLDGEARLAFSIAPRGAAFAPRGARELKFEVLPPELGAHATVRDVVGRVAGAAARALYAPFLAGAAAASETGMVDRDADGTLSVDLRTVPFVRRLDEGPFATLLDALRVDHVDITHGALVLRIALPPIGL